ncbi:hypothetical protein [Dactylosporangium sp. CA-092794]|uniref:hypothetical protein n=1 Tax=Dactylosporangium sp. CA-092794 TaxID=3239929 RepID=UPI003D8A62E6
MNDAPLTDEVARLRARLLDVEQRLASVTAAVNDLAGIAADVTALSERLTDQAPHRTAAAPPRPSWFEADAERAVALLTDLTDWVARILVRHVAAREALPECWMLHGEVVEELLWLKDAWAEAYHGPQSTPSLVADWHDRRLPGLMSRIKRYPGQNCGFAEHRGTTTGYRLREEHHPHDRFAPLTGEAVAAYARWWAVTRGLGPDVAPILPP